MVLGCRLKQA